MKHVVAVSLAIAALALTVAGCGGSKKSERVLTSDDLVGVVGPAPDTPAGATYSADATATELTLADLRTQAQNASDRATVALLAKSGFTHLYQRSFNGAVNVADATAYLFRDATGAGTALAGLQAILTRQAGPGQQLATVSADGIGDEAWGAHLTGGSEAALFLSRTSNVVVVTDMSCDSSCGLDIVSAARSYAEAIALRATEVGG